jgi:hypothetical protein
MCQTHLLPKLTKLKKRNNSDQFFGQKTGFGSFGSDLTGNNENLENIDDVELDTVISANSTSLDDELELFDLGSADE